MAPFLELLKTYQYFGWTAFGATVFLTPVAMRLAWRFGVLDIPDRELKPHARPIPYLGGTAICAAWVLAAVVALVTGVVTAWSHLLILMLGGVAMSVLGLVDDVRQVPPKWRLGLGALIVALAIVLTGTGTHIVDGFLAGVFDTTGIKLALPSGVATTLSMVIGVVIVLGACNSANLIDGLDGLCSGVTAIISLGFFLLAAHLALWDFSAAGDPVRLVLAIAMCGAALGFLPWNFNPARIFMGDAGSVLLGYNCGILILLFAEKSGVIRWIIAALMIFALPVFDTALAMFRRWRAGRSIFTGDRSHFYDQLVQRGYTVRQTVLISYALALIYGLLGLLLIWEHADGRVVIRTRYAIVLYVAVVVLTALLAWGAGLTHPEERARASQPDEDTPA